MWGEVLKRDLLGLSRQEDKFHNTEELHEYLKSEIKKQGKHVVIRDLDVSLVEDFDTLFYGIFDGVRTLDLSGWDTSNVKDMRNMFYGCNSLESIDLSGWDTSNVENMNWMFWNCAGLKSLDLSGWNTSKVDNMSGMFYSCEKLESIDLSGWDTSNVGIWAVCSLIVNPLNHLICLVGILLKLII